MTLSEVVSREMEGLVALSSHQLSQLEAHYRILLAWNSRMNLTTVSGLPEAGVRHYCESLFLGLHLTPGRVADIGSGPGFPGVPAAVLRDDCQFDLVESNGRKCVFLKEATRVLKNVSVRANRSEQLKPTEPYDWIISRAVDPAEVLGLSITKRFALLIGAEDAAKVGRGDVIPLPWGESRVLLIV